MNQLSCTRCNGKVFVDFTFTDNKDYETFCIICGDRKFVSSDDDKYKVINDYVRSKGL